MTLPERGNLTIAALVNKGQVLLGGGSDTRPRCIALLASILSLEVLKLRTMMHDSVDFNSAELYFSGLERLRKGEPDAYVLGYSYFYGHRLAVGPGVLIPRPDTETLVTTAWRYLQLSLDHFTEEESLHILEPCTGTGCISLALAGEWLQHKNTQARPGLQIYATDLSDTALDFARENLREMLELDLVRLEKADLWPSRLDKRCDFLISNPPYISDAEYQDLAAEVREHEPHQALWAGLDGLDFYRRIFAEAGQYLKPGAYVMLEHGYQQGKALAALTNGSDYKYLELVNDLAGRERVSVWQYLPRKESEAAHGG